MSLPCSLPSLPLFFLLSIIPSSLVSPSVSHSPLRWTSSQDPCYHLDGRPRHCLSEFINAAYGIPVRAADSWGGVEKNVSSLTDLHNPHNLTCWVGEGVGGDWTLMVPLGRRFEVTYISLQFCQQGELQDSHSISIFKSMDHGRSWRPLQFYSSDCPGKFGLPSRTSAPSRHQETEPFCSDPRPLQRHRGGLVLAFSTLDGRPSSPDFDYSPVLQDWVTATDIKVVFHRHQGKQLKEDFGRGESGALRWRAEFIGDGRGQTDRKGDQRIWGRPRTGLIEPGFRWKWEEKGRGEGRGRGVKRREGHPRMMCADIVCDWTVEGQGRNSRARELRRRRNNNRRVEAQTKQRKWSLQQAQRPPSSLSSLSAPSSIPALSLSDLQVGGRCKCNGHASRCRRDSEGRAVCQCEHHTAGPDCDVCEPFYCDRPWQRATPSQPHPCIPCECNGHSTKCRFSMEVFQQSGRQSGGVCLKCRHHTAGRHCQYCQSGYTRDHSKPMTHRKACRPCQCHPMGAVGRWCNQTSGQCLCRDGVTGVRCNRCAPGYQQGRSPIRPCLRQQWASQIYNQVWQISAFIPAVPTCLPAVSVNPCVSLALIVGSWERVGRRHFLSSNQDSTPYAGAARHAALPQSAVLEDWVSLSQLCQSGRGGAGGLKMPGPFMARVSVCGGGSQRVTLDRLPCCVAPASILLGGRPDPEDHTQAQTRPDGRTRPGASTGSESKTPSNVPDVAWRIQELVPTTPVYQPQYSIAEECSSYCQPSQVKVKMNLETYCLKDYVLKAQVRGMERSGPWWQFSVWVQTVFRVGAASRVRRGQQALWVPDRDLGCGCPALQVGRTFLLIGAEDGQSWGPEESRLVADRSSLALPWREHWSPKLRVFRGQDRRGRCPTEPLRNSTRPPSHQRPHVEFIPPHLEPSRLQTPPPHPLPPTEARPPPPTHSHHESRPTEESRGPLQQYAHHTQPPTLQEGSPQHTPNTPPPTDRTHVPPTQQSRRKPKPLHTRKHSPTTATPMEAQEDAEGMSRNLGSAAANWPRPLSYRESNELSPNVGMPPAPMETGGAALHCHKM
ncbi:hypothetical protein JZ751_006681 [Albula glossodonta]|uniref:Netrin 5 n=1 Tax=Albula glossodonta TaxID=121402 RepID=A0A8T2P3K5_9TELE|nr:hypothetical protein JZ751_006681 [Albula glossodonta]